jgi:pimeloyl-ACP methyl ester carboxylesterase
MLVKIALALAGLYLLVIAIMTLAQTALLFPARMAAVSHMQPPPHARRLDFAAPDGQRLHGIHIPPSIGRPRNSALLLGFGGNAWNAETLAAYLHTHAPGRDVIVFYYRGYRPSEGSAGAAALMRDAIAAHDHVVSLMTPDRVIAIGLSIGCGPAVHLARHRRIAGAILVTPFDSLKALASEQYWWAPVGLLLRHRMEVAQLAAETEAPIAVIAAGRDTIVPSRRTEALRRSIRHLVLDRTIAEAGHNDIYDHPAFAAALREAITLIESIV